MDTRLSNDVPRTDRGVDPWVAEAVGGVMDVEGGMR
jgi:hypothetical protein